MQMGLDPNVASGAADKKQLIYLAEQASLAIDKDQIISAMPTMPQPAPSPSPPDTKATRSVKQSSPGVSRQEFVGMTREKQQEVLEDLRMKKAARESGMATQASVDEGSNPGLQQGGIKPRGLDIDELCGEEGAEEVGEVFKVAIDASIAHHSSGDSGEEVAKQSAWSWSPRQAGGVHDLKDQIVGTSTDLPDEFWQIEETCKRVTPQHPRRAAMTRFQQMRPHFRQAQMKADSRAQLIASSTRPRDLHFGEKIKRTDIEFTSGPNPAEQVEETCKRVLPQHLRRSNQASQVRRFKQVFTEPTNSEAHQSSTNISPQTDVTKCKDATPGSSDQTSAAKSQQATSIAAGKLHPRQGFLDALGRCFTRMMLHLVSVGVSAFSQSSHVEANLQVLCSQPLHWMVECSCGTLRLAISTGRPKKSMEQAQVVLAVWLLSLVRMNSGRGVATEMCDAGHWIVGNALRWSKALAMERWHLP